MNKIKVYNTKWHKRKIKSINEKMIWKQYKLYSKSFCMLTAKQIEAARRVITKTTEKQGKIQICVKPTIPLTFKPIESRMGKGIGKFRHNVAKIVPGDTIFILSGVSKSLAKKALFLASKKLPIKWSIF